MTIGRDEIAREQARQKGLKRYTGHMCNECGSTLRFVHCNACVRCKQAADKARYHKLHFTEAELREGSGVRLSEEVNRKFLSDLAKEKAGWNE